MIGRRVWLITTLVVVGLGAAGLYADHEARLGGPTTEPVAAAPAGVQPLGGAEKETTITAAPTSDESPSDDGVEKSLAKAGVAPTSAAKARSDASEQNKDDRGAPPTPAKPAPPAGEPDPVGDIPEPPEGNVPAHSPALQHPHRYGDRESYEGVPPGQAPETRGGAGRGN